MTTNPAVEKILKEKQVEALVDKALDDYNPVMGQPVKTRARARLTQRLLSGQETPLDTANLRPYVLQALFESEENDKARETERQNLHRTRWP